MVNRTPRPAVYSGNPLASDEPSLAMALPSTPVELGGSPAALNLGNAPVEFGGSPSAEWRSGLTSLPSAPNINDAGFAQALNQIGSQPLLQPSTEAQPSMFYSPSTGQMMINGFTFNQRNATQALQSEHFAAQPRRDFTLPDTASDWRPLSQQEYSSYIDTIRNPGFGRRVSEAWETGWRGAGDIALGGGMAVAEATGNHWRWGEVAHQNIVREYEENAPFIMGVQDIHNPGDMLTFAAQMLVQAVPWVVETIASMVGGAVIGGAVSGGVGAPAGAIEGFIAKEGVRRATMIALRTSLRNGAQAYTEAAAGRVGAALTREEVLANAARTGTATPDEVNRFFNFGERAFHLSRGSGALTAGEGTGQMASSYGAQVGSVASNYAMGVGDIHNSIVDAGGDPTTATSIANIWGWALPYALVESAGDMILTQPITHLFPEIHSGPSHIGNALRHAGLVGTGEGIEEGLQYGIDQQAVASSTNTPISIDPIDLLNNMAGGVFGGMGIGAVVGGMGPKTPPRTTTTPPGSSSPPSRTPSPGPTVRQPEFIGEYPGTENDGRVVPTPAGMSTGVGLGELPPFVPQTREQPSYPGNVFDNEPIVPGQPTIAPDQAGLEPEIAANRYPASRQPEFIGEYPGTENDRRDAVNSMDRSQVDLPPGLANTTTYSQPQTRLLPREAEEIFKDMATGIPVPMNEMVQLRTAIAERASKNPTNPGYANVLSQLDDHIAQQRAVDNGVTDENSQAFKDKYPELADHLARKAMNEPKYSQSPMDAARGPQRATQNDQGRRQAIIDKLGAGGDAIKNATDAQLKAGQDAIAYREAQPSWKLEPKTVQDGHRALAHRIQKEVKDRASTNDNTASTPRESIAQEDYITKAEEAGKKARKNLKRKEERARQKERNKLTDKAAIKDTRDAMAAEDNATLGNREHKSEIRSPEGTAELPLLKKAKELGTLGRNPNRANLNKGNQNAVQERSTTPVSRKEPPEDRAAVRGGDTAGDKTSGARQAEEQKSREIQAPESIRAAEKDTADNRVDRAYNALLARAKGSESIPAKDPAQAVRAILGVIKRAEKDNRKPNLNLLKNPWLQIDGKVLTKEELLAVEAKFGGERKITTTEPTAVNTKKDTTSSFGADLSQYRKDHGDKNLVEYVLKHRDEVLAWLVSKDANEVRRGLKSTVENILRDNPEIQRAATKGAEAPTPIQHVKNIIKEVQVRLPKAFRFSSVHVFTDLEDLLRRANGEIMTRQGGPEISIGRYIVDQVARFKKANPKLAEHSDEKLIVAWINEYLMGRAAVVTPYKALIVFSSNIKSTNELIETLEHEYVVHRGLSVLFPDSGARVAFLDRVLSIPGMQYKLQELLVRFPAYRNLTLHQQAEEMLAIHSEEGPLALKALLSAKEGADPTTRRTLWEDFKQLVSDWIARVFPGTVSQADKALNTIVGALREHALLGSGESLNAVLDKLNVAPLNSAIALAIKEFNSNNLIRAGKEFDYDASEYMGRDEEDIFGSFLTQELNNRTNPNTPPTGEEMATAIATAREKTKSILAQLKSRSEIKQAATAGTPEATHELLFGTNDDPGRPYQPLPWGQHMVGIMNSNQELIEKLKAMADKGAGTTLNEALKKVGRNLETMGQKAMRSMLIKKTMEIMHATIGEARTIMTKIQEGRVYARADALTDSWRKLWGDKAPGSTERQRKNYGRMAIVATINRMAAATEEVVKAFPRILVKGADGLYSVNMAVFEEALKRGILTKEEFKAEKGVEQFVVSGDGKRTSTGFAKLAEKDIDDSYDIYVAESRHMAESMLKMLTSTLTMLNQKNSVEVEKLIKANEIKGPDADFMREVLQRMYKVYSDIAFDGYTTGNRTQRAKQQNKARQVLAELMRTMHNKEKLADWTDSSRTRKNAAKSPRLNDAFKWREQTSPADDVKAFASQINWFLEKDSITGKTRFERLNGLGVKAPAQFDMLGAFQGMLNSEVTARQRENETIQQALGNYVEFAREGEWRVFLNVTDEKGNKVSVAPELYAMLPVSFTDSEREAKELMQQRGQTLAGTFTINDEEDNPQKVKFDVGYEKAPTVSTLAEAPNIKEFLRVGDVLGLKLNATQMAEIANLIENASNRKQLGLQRANTPGMSAKVLENNSKTLTRRAWAAAKTSQAWMLDDVFADDKNVHGDPELLQRLQDNFDIANRGAPEGTAPPVNFVRNEAAVWLAERDLIEYAHQMKYMSRHTLARPTINIRTTKGEQKLKIEPEGETHRADATAMRESLKRDELEVNLNDLLSKTGPLRMMAVVMQLGSIASGIMNAFTIITHLPWVLIADNIKNGYGGGFQFSEVVHAIGVAFSQVMNPAISLDNSLVLKDLVEAAKKGNNVTGLDIHELESMYEQTLDGLLSPQQTYSMTGGTESNIPNLLARQLAEALLKPFGAVEAANRRVSFLVMYRLAKARYIAAGVAEDKLNDHTSDEYKRLIKDIQNVVWNSQGDYSNVNTPKAFRGDLAKYVMLYKMFPLMTTQMINNLPYKQQLSVLAVLLLLGGLKGEPYAEDFMDIYDTLLQKLGVRHDSVELELIQTLEKIMPGSSRWIMHGAVDSLALGGTMSSRVSMGDIIPFTGAFREGADWGRELNNAFGPAYSANAAAVEWAWTLTDFVLQSAGIKPQVTSGEELIRKFPQTQIRALGEAYLMGTTGQITDPQGRLTSDDVTAWSVFARALGLYPLEATKANDAVRLDRMHIGYMRAVRSRFILAYANAYRAHDEGRMDALRQQVSSWNEAARQNGQTDMLINNFNTAAMRAGRAASQTTVERTIASAPDYSMLEELAGITGADTTTDAESGD